jgi:putative transcriptional regulator
MTARPPQQPLSKGGCLRTSVDDAPRNTFRSKFAQPESRQVKGGIRELSKLVSLRNDLVHFKSKPFSLEELEKASDFHDGPNKRLKGSGAWEELENAHDVQADVVMKIRIRVLRAEKDWSQVELAERVRVSRNSVKAIENGRFDPSLPLAFRIADAFGLSVEEVFDKTDV